MKIKNGYLSSLIITAASILSGCMSQPFESSDTSQMYMQMGSKHIAATFNAVDALLDTQSISPFLEKGDFNNSVLVSTIVDIDKLDSANTLGRLISEHVSSRLAQRGISVNEVKLRGDLYVEKGQGEMLLSRELKNISASQNSSMVITGTYAVAGEMIFVTLKLVRASDTRISSAYSYVVPKNGIWELTKAKN